MKNNNPCIQCTDRTPGCHTRCPDGIAQDKAEKERREKIKTEREKDMLHTCYKRDTVDFRVRRG